MAEAARIRVAFGSVPKDGGTFTFYRNIRQALAARGIDMFCVTLGRPQSLLWDDRYADENCVRLAPNARSMKRQAQAFLDWCAAERIDIVMGINSEGILSALPHLPEQIRAMSRCANAFDHGYKITMSGHERLAKIVALTPRLRDDLTRSYGADLSKIVLIPNGIEEHRFAAAAQTPRGQGRLLEIGFLGRLEHTQKGVLYIPDIVDELKRRGVAFRLRIAGQGRDRTQMEDQMRGHITAGDVEFLGALGPNEVPQFLADSDVYLFTSHFEGCPNALLEAMMAGCVPVSGLIEGITDFLIEPSRTGFLCTLGDAVDFADHIETMAKDRTRLAQLSKAVAVEARARFTEDHAADAYAEIFREIMDAPPPRVTPRLWSDFKPDPNFPGYWRNNIPPALKTIFRKLKG